MTLSLYVSFLAPVSGRSYVQNMFSVICQWRIVIEGKSLWREFMLCLVMLSLGLTNASTTQKYTENSFVTSLKQTQRPEESN